MSRKQMTEAETAKLGDMKVWWIPQVPGKRFEVSVINLAEAKLLVDVLADYDAFQFANNIKPDYCNAGGVLVFGDEGWDDWCDDDGVGIEGYSLEKLRHDARS